MFTLISMGLLRRGARLTRNSYVQETLGRKNSRRKLAWTIWKSGLGDEETRWLPQAPRTAGQTAAEEGQSKRAQRSAQNKKRRKGESRLVPGGARMRSLLVWYERTRKDEDVRKGRKRDAKSEAEEDADTGADRRIQQPRKRRGKHQQKATKAGSMATS